MISYKRERKEKSNSHAIDVKKLTCFQDLPFTESLKIIKEYENILLIFDKEMITRSKKIKKMIQI